MGPNRVRLIAPHESASIAPMPKIDKNLMGLTLLTAVVLLWQPIRASNDIWWHLATGRYLFHTHHIPKQDVFSWTMAGHPWINHEWLFDVLSYISYSIGGFSGLVAVKVILILGALWPVWRTFEAQRIPILLRWILLAVIFWTSRYAWNVRADLVSLVFIAWLCHDLNFYQRDRTVSFLIRWSFLFFLWANLHGAFFLGLALLFGSGFGLKLEKRAKARDVLRLYACAAATLINPWGWRLHLSLGEGLVMLQNAGISEWARTPWHPLEFFWLNLLFYWSLQFRQIRRDRQIAWSRLWMGVLLSYAAISHVRNVPAFMLGSFPFVGVWIVQEIRDQSRISPFENRTLKRLALISTLLVFLISVPAMSSRMALSAYPADACLFLDQPGLAGRFYNDYDLGSYWLWHFGTRRPVFIDGRLHAVEGYPTLYKDIVTAKAQGPQAWNAFLSRYGVDGVLVTYPKDSPIPSIFHLYFPRSHWALVYWDDAGLVFLRRLPKFKSVIARDEFKAIDPDMSPDALKIHIHQAPSVAKFIQNDLRRNLKIHPNSHRTQDLLLKIT